MGDYHEDVLAFHRKFGCPIGSRPVVPTIARFEFRERLINEEFRELCEAHTAEDLPAIADAIIDLMYVVVGTAIEYGIDVRPLWDEVNAANMRKSGRTTTGKVHKPEGWQPPNIQKLLAEQPPIDQAKS